MPIQIQVMHQSSGLFYIRSIGHAKNYLTATIREILYQKCQILWARLQSMAVFDKILGAEKAQILGAGAQNCCQVRIMSDLRGKSNKICVKNNEN